MTQTLSKIRYPLLDSLRGATLISMMLYHAAWDMVYIFGADWPWYRSSAAFFWQQSICWTFILLSGFCFPLGRRKLRRGVTVLAASAVITAATVLFMPENLILFGVLSLIGSAMCIMALLEGPFQRTDPRLGTAVCFLLFLLTRWVNRGVLSLPGRTLLVLPEGWYANLFTAYLGFPAPDFVSQDYFSLIPWLFLYQAGVFLHHLCRRASLLERLSGPRIPPLEWLGRRSLILYMLHQPVIYGLLWAADTLFK